MIFSQLTHIAHVQTLRRRLRLVAIHILLIAVFLLLLQAVDCIACLRESTTGQLTILATAVSALSMFFFLFLDFRHPRKAANVAKDIECSEPQFKDALNCTIELEQQPADKLNDVERLLVQRTNRVFDDNEKQILSSQRKRYRHSLPLLLTAILSIILLGEFSPVCQKAFCWLEEKITGVSTGIVIISPQENSFLIHSDIRVQVGVHRGPTAATIHYQTSGGDCETYPMHPIEDSPGESSIVLYDISGPTQYKITTDLLETPWMELTTYPIPTVKSVSMKTSPQAYTGLQPQSFNEFSDVTIVGGDSVQLEVAIENGSAIALKSEDELLSMTPKGNLYTLDFVPQKTTAWDVVITDMHQRLHTVGNFIITVTPDLPPVIEKQEPAEDAKLKPRDSLRFSVNATDDFGLTKFALVYRIIGKEQTSRDLLTKDSHGTRECNASFLWDISAMKLTPGDVIACMLIAVDNRLPKPNVTRSDAFYVSIIPDAEDITADGESSQKEQKIDISDLIAESKRLLRATWDIQSLESPSETMLEETTIALKDLRIEALRRM
ncbi:MAG: hypothetical protein J6X55_13195, partial [Victivallales bacterium]|nr:hypothetical protein [Victivallales bacterium]